MHVCMYSCMHMHTHQPKMHEQMTVINAIMRKAYFRQLICADNSRERKKKKKRTETNKYKINYWCAAVLVPWGKKGVWFYMYFNANNLMRENNWDDEEV